MHYHKPAVALAGVFQRLPYLLAAIVILLWGAAYPLAALAAAFAAPVVSGLIGGLTLVGWQELVAKTIPPERRSSLWAWRYVIGGLMGLFAAGLVKIVLAHFGSPAGYGLLHLLAFALLGASFVVFLMVRETNMPRRPDPTLRSPLHVLYALPAMLRADGDLRRYLGVMFFANFLAVVVPYLVLHAKDEMGITRDDAAGLFVFVNMAAVIGGNLLSGWGGDRFGPKRVLAVCLVAAIVGCVWATFARSGWGIIVSALLIYGSRAGTLVGLLSMNMELAPDNRRPMYLTLMAAATAPTLVGVMLVSWAGWALSGQTFAVVAAISGICAFLSLVFLARVRNPRKETQVGPL
jgi:MFS family permease